MNKYIDCMRVANGIFWIEIQEADLRILCGSPSDSIKHLMKKNIIVPEERNNYFSETGPNAILLSDILIQHGSFSNLAEFPVLQMLYRQGMAIPGHPNNTGIKPLLIGSKEQISSQKEYIFRGNYGLISEKELIQTGMKKDEAKELMDIKVKFAFGKILKTDELLDSLIVEGNKKIEIRNKVFIKRKDINIFQISYKNEKVDVDLNLKDNERYEAPYPLGYFSINRDYFSIVHSGEGDGWDINRPCMASILIYQGKVYLIDCGPNILDALDSLGISVSEIEGIFHTHCHDDHFGGLTSLMRSDHKIKYYSVPSVRLSVTKKLSALLCKDESEFSIFFDIIDLKIHRWNDVDSLLVKPIFSPHPVETTIFQFKAPGPNGYKIYGHYADIIDLNVLAKMKKKKKADTGISNKLFNKVKENYLTKLDLKKLDIGGGMIHGNAADFKNDKSERILLAHTAKKLSSEQKKIGSSGSFGMVDIMVPSFHEYERQRAFNYLATYFPDVSKHQIEILLNNQIEEFNPGTIFIKNDTIPEYIYLILSGNVEMFEPDTSNIKLFSAGSMIGEISGLNKTKCPEIFRSRSYVKTLAIPVDMYEYFITKNRLRMKNEVYYKRYLFLRKTYLFGEEISAPVKNKIIQSMSKRTYKKNHTFSINTESGLYLLKNGRLKLYLNNFCVEEILPGRFWNSSSLLFGLSCIMQARVLEDSEIYHIPLDVIKDIPIVRWKVMEVYEKRFSKVFKAPVSKTKLFKFEKDYSVNCTKIDEQHKKLIKLGAIVANKIGNDDTFETKNSLKKLINFTEEHFKTEEKFLESKNYPEIERHKMLHSELINKITDYIVKFENGEKRVSIDFITFLQSWIMEHIAIEDKKYKEYFLKE